ncbi:MAG: ShlB/FhaC/HecB family hemolysin secretion/activation protein [Alphaproteobacteria bacterium]|nr:MAG: ShlB/FhaC/HecB family hemolysin secretion/activation protein [Alphaproteobacteria bacterium]
MREKTRILPVLWATFCFLHLCASVHASDIDRASRQAIDMAQDLREKNQAERDITFYPSENTLPLKTQEIEGADDIAFVLEEITFDGLTVLAEKELKPAWEDLIGAEVKLSDINDVAVKATQILREKGFTLARVVIPPQDIEAEEGHVTIQVFEGTLNSVRVEGGSETDRIVLEHQLKSIVTGGPFNLYALEERLRFIKKTPGYKIQSIFVAAKDKSAAADLIIKIEGKRYASAGLMFDNGGNRLMGNHRAGVDALIYNPVGRSKLLFANVQDHQRKHLIFNRVRQTQFVGDKGTRMYAEYLQSRSRPFLSIPMQSRFDYINMMLMHPFVYRRGEELKLRIGVDGQNDSTRVAGVRTKKDYIRTLQIGLLYNQSHENDFWEVSALLHKGFSGVFGGKSTHLPSKQGGKNNFAYADGRAIWVHQFNETLSVANIIGWQYAAHPLLASEEFSVGSSNYARGYDGSEIVGDSGVGGIIELRYMLPIKNRYVNYVQIYTSYGAAQTHTHRKKADSLPNAYISSYAIGLRAQVIDNLAVTYELAKPVARRVALQANKKLHHSFKVTWRSHFEKSFPKAQ